MVSHSQYVCPDAYLSPLASSFDAGTSPLALLEKTCLSVGHPDPPGKSGKSILSSDKSSPAKKDGGSQSSPDKSKTSSSPTDGKRKDTPGSSSSKSERAASVGGPKTDENGNKTKASETGSDAAKAGSRPTSAPTEPGAATSQPIPPSLPSLPTPSRGLHGFPSYPGLPGFPPPGFPSSPYSHAMAGFPFSAYSGFSPLAGFGPSSMPRPGLPCLDVNCKTCPPSPLAGRPCPLGCTQCSGSHHNDLSAMWLSSYSSLFHGGLPPPPGSLFPSISTSSKLPASLPTASTPSAAAPLPHFCSWVTPSGVCYKSFATSDELLQHVKSHTSGSEAAVSAASSIPGLPSPGRQSPRSAYLSAALRFHPYGKPMGPPPPPFPPGLGYSALSALYAGHRLPGSLPHP